MKDLSVGELIAAAGTGSQGAWNELVSRYMPLVLAVIRRYRLFGQDAEDVSQTVWLRLVEHLDDLRVAEALPKWLATTTRNETLRLFKARQRVMPVDPVDVESSPLDTPLDQEVDSAILAAERRQEMRDALRDLSGAQQELLALLAADPPVAYAEISHRLNIPIGSIGPTRRRLLEKLRHSPALHSLSSPLTTR